MKSTIYKIFIGIAVIFSINTYGFAQSKITGRVIDELSQPMAFANVMLLNGADSSFRKGAITKDDGTLGIYLPHYA